MLCSFCNGPLGWWLSTLINKNWIIIILLTPFNTVLFCVLVTDSLTCIRSHLWRTAALEPCWHHPHISAVLAQRMGESCRSTLQNAEESIGSVPQHGPEDANSYCLSEQGLGIFSQSQRNWLVLGKASMLKTAILMKFAWRTEGKMPWHCLIRTSTAHSIRVLLLDLFAIPTCRFVPPFLSFSLIPFWPTSFLKSKVNAWRYHDVCIRPSHVWLPFPF